MNRRVKYILQGLGGGGAIGAGTGASTAAVHPDIETTPNNIGQSALIGAGIGGTLGALGGTIHQNKKLKELIEILEPRNFNKKANLVRDYIDGQSNLS